MMIEIKHKREGQTLFAAETAVNNNAELGGADLWGADLRDADLAGAELAGAELGGADLTGASLVGADLSGAYLRGAYLRGAYLRDADLTGAHLSGADLRGAHIVGALYRDGVVKTTPITITGFTWDVLIIAGYIRIGCQEHTTQAWRDFSDDEISLMAPGALEFWRANKEWILALGE